MVPLAYYLLLSAVLFGCGVAGFLIKRNIITIFMCIELMLNGVNLAFVAFAAHWHQLNGQVFVFFVMVVAAAEAAVGDDQVRPAANHHDRNAAGFGRAQRLEKGFLSAGLGVQIGRPAHAEARMARQRDVGRKG